MSHGEIWGEDISRRAVVMRSHRGWGQRGMYETSSEEAPWPELGEGRESGG